MATHQVFGQLEGVVGRLSDDYPGKDGYMLWIADARKKYAEPPTDVDEYIRGLKAAGTALRGKMAVPAVPAAAPVMAAAAAPAVVASAAASPAPSNVAASDAAAPAASNVAPAGAAALPPPASNVAASDAAAEAEAKAKADAEAVAVAAAEAEAKAKADAEAVAAPGAEAAAAAAAAAATEAAAVAEAAAKAKAKEAEEAEARDIETANEAVKNGAKVIAPLPDTLAGVPALGYVPPDRRGGRHQTPKRRRSAKKGRKGLSKKKTGSRK